MQKSRISNILASCISVIFGVIVLILTILSIKSHCKVDIYSVGNLRQLETHRPIIYIGLAIVEFLILFIVYFTVSIILNRSKNSRKIVYIISLCIIGVVVAVCLFWICFNDTMPKLDQEMLFHEARKLAGYDHEPYNVSYFELYPRNKGLVLTMAFMLKIFGDTQISFRILNVMGAVVLIFSAEMIVKKVWMKENLTLLVTVLLAFFYPIIVYTSYLYGTLLAAAFSALGMYQAIRYYDKGSKKHVIISVIAFAFAIQMHQSAAIVVIATICSTIFFLHKGNWKRFFEYIILIVLSLALVNGISGRVYEKKTGYETTENAVPTLAYINMGISAEKGEEGPGSQDGSAYAIYKENEFDSHLTNQDALERIYKITREYMTGKRSLSFFVEKTKYQWLDPTFGARKTIDTNESNSSGLKNSDQFIQFYNSSYRDLIFKLAVGNMIMVYMLNLFVMCVQLIKRKYDGLIFFIQILLIGGFIFQLFWESMSRYCFAYFLWLIPGAAYGINIMYDIMSASEREQAKPAHRKRRMSIMNEVHDIMKKKLG